MEVDRGTVVVFPEPEVLVPLPLEVVPLPLLEEDVELPDPPVLLLPLLFPPPPPPLRRSIRLDFGRLVTNGMNMVESSNRVVIL